MSMNRSPKPKGKKTRTWTWESQRTICLSGGCASWAVWPLTRKKVREESISFVSFFYLRGCVYRRWSQNPGAHDGVSSNHEVFGFLLDALVAAQLTTDPEIAQVKKERFVLLLWIECAVNALDWTHRSSLSDSTQPKIGQISSLCAVRV